MNALDQHERNMKRMVNNVSQDLGPRKGIEAVKSRDELMKATETNENVDYWKNYAESKKQSDKLEKQINKGDGILGKLLSDTRMDKNYNVYTRWFPTRFALDALTSEVYIPLLKEFTQYCKKNFGLDKVDAYALWIDYTHEVVKMISDLPTPGDEELDEYTSAGSAGAFSAPLGWSNDRGMNKPQNEEELDEMTGSASSGAYSQPAIWAKNKKNWRAVSDPNFPKYGGPGAKYVKIKEKCRKFPYCNQGSIDALEFYEDKNLQEAIKKVSKKTNKSEKYLKNIILQEMESMFKKDMKKYKKKKMRPYSKEEIDEMIRRGFYHSPITSLVGNVKMDKPIGQIYSMKGNKPKYE